jgi:drug/metabolite transporter (DMT)-like permease
VSTASEGSTRALVSMPGLLLLGLLSAALFSSNFVLNRAMSLSGGHWVWSASIRYLYTALLLGGWLLCRRGPGHMLILLDLFWRKLRFWLMAGGIGYGVFYACLCFAADHAPGWVTAASYQLTILATPVVLRAFGKRVPVQGIVFLALIFLGIITINAERILQGIPPGQVLAGVLPAVIAACTYPVGNQLISEAKHAGDSDAAILSDPVVCVFLLTLGALPVLLALIPATMPPPPSREQLISTAVVALLAGCLATTLFMFARNLSADPYRIAAVDATQAGEPVFALLGEMIVLGAPALDLPSWVGLGAVVGGLLGFSLWQRR